MKRALLLMAAAWPLAAQPKLLLNAQTDTRSAAPGLEREYRTLLAAEPQPAKQRPEAAAHEAEAIEHAQRAGDVRQERRAATAYAGGIVLVGFALVDGALQFATADSVGDVPAGVTQSISVLYSDFFVGFPVGFGTLLLATAVVLLRTRVLPMWLGWFALVLGIAAFLGPIGFVAFLVFPVWVAIVSMVLYQRGEPAAAPPPTPTTV